LGSIPLPSKEEWLRHKSNIALALRARLRGLRWLRDIFDSAASPPLKVERRGMSQSSSVGLQPQKKEGNGPENDIVRKRRWAKPRIIIAMEENDNQSVAADQDLPQTLPPEQQEIEALKRERDDLFDRLLRKQAEFENFKKRMDRDKSEYAQFASADLMKEMLNALDSFDLAIRNAAAEANGGNMLRGFELIHKQLQDTLTRFGLKPLEAKGKKFDPNFHQAVSTKATNDVEENTIVDEMRKGYTLNGRLLRPAMVTVSIKE
jgi:molecular chaperone GrpE